MHRSLFFGFFFFFPVGFCQRGEKDWIHDEFVLWTGGLVVVSQLSVLEYHQPLR